MQVRILDTFSIIMLTATKGGFSRCPTGFTGKNCETNIDECEDPNMCVNGNCTDTFGSYTCHCKPGWQGSKCDADVNECNSRPCCRGQCVNQIGSYMCKCPIGN